MTGPDRPGDRLYPSRALGWLIGLGMLLALVAGVVLVAIAITAGDPRLFVVVMVLLVLWSTVYLGRR